MFGRHFGRCIYFSLFHYSQSSHEPCCEACLLNSAYHTVDLVLSIIFSFLFLSELNPVYCSVLAA